MNYRWVLILFLFAFNKSFCQFKSIEFIGYKDRSPVFTDANDKIFIYKVSNFTTLEFKNVEYFPIIWKDNNILTWHNQKYVVFKGKEKSAAFFKKDAWDITPTITYDSLVYVEGDIDNEVGVVYNEIKFYDIKSKKETGTGVRGLSPFVVENYVYFMEYSVKNPQESTYDAINLKRFKINNAKKIEDILDKASRSSIYVIPGNKYIITSIQFRDASIHYTVYDIEKRKFAVLGKKESDGFRVFWDYQSSKICFYDRLKMTFDYWSLPSEFPNNRSDKKIYFFNQNGVKN